jgi:hypothetical protein
MKTISTQLFDEFTSHNLSGFAWKSTVKKYFAPQFSTSNLPRPLTFRSCTIHCIRHDIPTFSEISPLSKKIKLLWPKQPTDLGDLHGQVKLCLFYSIQCLAFKFMDNKRVWRMGLFISHWGIAVFGKSLDYRINFLLYNTDVTSYNLGRLPREGNCDVLLELWRKWLWKILFYWTWSSLIQQSRLVHLEQSACFLMWSIGNNLDEASVMSESIQPGCYLHQC